MNSKELDQNLARFYVEARTKKGEEYSRSALLGFRNSLTAELQIYPKNGKWIHFSVVAYLDNPHVNMCHFVKNTIKWHHFA